MTDAPKSQAPQSNLSLRAIRQSDELINIGDVAIAANINKEERQESSADVVLWSTPGSGFAGSRP